MLLVKHHLQWCHESCTVNTVHVADTPYSSAAASAPSALLFRLLMLRTALVWTAARASGLVSPQAAATRVITMTLVGVLLGALYLRRERVRQLITLTG